jgi:DNA-binding CsgD family transcriptional regulator
VRKRGSGDQPSDGKGEIMLRRADLQRSFATLGAVAEQSDDAEAFARAGVRELPALVSSELTTLSVCHLKTGRRDVVGFPDARLSTQDRLCFDRFFAEHPLVSFHADKRGRGAHRISDSVPFARFREGALYNEYYRSIGIDHVVALPVLVNQDMLVSFVLNRKRRDFSDRETELLDRVGPFLARLYRGLCRADGISPRTANPALRSLTSREREVHRWVVAGKTDRDIASILACSHRTVQKHLQRIYEKLGVETRTAAAMRGIASPPS